MKPSGALAMVAMALGLVLGVASASIVQDRAVPGSGDANAPPGVNRQQGSKAMVEKRDAPPAPPPASSEPAPIGAGAPIADMRDAFRELSRQQPRNPAAERAFIESKIDLIRGDPRLSADEKKAAIADLRRMLDTH